MRWISYLFTLVILVHLAWDANTEPEVTGYKLYYGTSSRTYNPPINVGNVTDFTISVDETQPIFIAVTAYSDSSESDYSTELECAVLNRSIVGKGTVTFQQEDWTSSKDVNAIVVEKLKHTIVTSTPNNNFKFTSMKVNDSWLPPASPYELTPPSSINEVKVIFQKHYSLTGIEWIK